MPIGVVLHGWKAWLVIFTTRSDRGKSGLDKRSKMDRLDTKIGVNFKDCASVN